ncbi:polyunsaturated fatty acid lipoxygenase ALOX15B [Paramormyrops kingsleyae]|uniref:polyunsaturated fatty acid lipoxygenase ALOX15B n=1 Tax=Paramormyrops kingsleyae TaxID=1676925 RepID=UPI003B96FF51
MEEEYRVTVRTAMTPNAGSYGTAQVTLLGTQAVSPTVSVGNGKQRLTPGSGCVITVRTKESLGSVALVRLCLEGRPGFPDLDWLCQGVEVTTLSSAPEGRRHTEYFPCSKWLRTADGSIVLWSRRVCIVNLETVDVLKDHRVQQLQIKQKIFRWSTFAEGLPHCVDMASVNQLGPNMSYMRQSPGTNLLYLRGFGEMACSWSSLEDMELLFAHNSQGTTTAKYVHAHWKEDSFFGYQCLNGCNPLMLHRIQHIPPNMSVTPDMLHPFLPEGSSLEQEIKLGTIFLLDYKLLEGVPANTINGKQQYLAAPLCLLHSDQQGHLKPIAIQVLQTPSPQNPVFVPSDPELDWLLAKTWVRCADFQCHQLTSHFLRTHILGEVVCIATLRQFPEMHPLYQLLMPHIWSTLQINIQARMSLLAPGGVFDKSIGCGLKGIPVLLRNATQQLSYRSLCVPDDLEDRGVASLPQSYYAQDSLRVWAVLHSFVSNWVDLYYNSNSNVEQDAELQNWIQEIFTHGFLQLSQSGIPQSFQTKMELSKFVTMIIYSCSALHAAVNFSQLEFSLWMPNSPPTMNCPPPQSKGSVTMDDFLSILPDVNVTCSVLITLSLLSQPGADFIPLCQYREEHFSSDAPRRLVEALQRKLKSLSAEIADRNSQLELPYPYLSPDRIENSVTI